MRPEPPGEDMGYGDVYPPLPPLQWYETALTPIKRLQRKM